MQNTRNVTFFTGMETRFEYVEVEPEPGETEGTPLLPTFISEDGGFNFEIDTSLYEQGLICAVAGGTCWIDPVIATGYTYTITGAEFASVTAPSLGIVNDPDGYVLTVGGAMFGLLAGETYFFDDDVTEFTITGIATDLALDPTNPMAFATGVSFRDFTEDTFIVTQTPITLDVPDVAPVPLPAGGVLLGAGLLGLLAMRRRRV